MKITLKDLKKNKGQKKTFKFLTPVVDLLKKEYKKILSEFDLSMYGEALNEIIGDNGTVAVYDTPEKLRYGVITKNNRNFSLDHLDRAKGNGIENISITLYKTTKEPEKAFLNKEDYWNSRYAVKLEDLYVVTDTKAFEEFVFESMLEDEKKEIERIKKREEEERTKIKETGDLLKKFGTKVDTSKGRLALSILKAIKEDDEKKAFDMLLKATDYISDEIEEAVEDRW